MLFLTYIQGPATTEWVHSISDWLEQAVQVSHEFNQRLWDYTEEGFQRKFGDTVSEERAIAELEDGIKMEKGDLDSFINRFEILVHHAQYDPDHPMVLRKFTDGLPLEMYKTIYGRERPPVGYQQWREAAVDQQRKWVHVRGRLDLFKTTKPKPQFPKPQWNNTRGSSWPKDPNAMDTSPGRVKAQVTEVDDFACGGNRWPQSVNNPANRPNKFQPAKQSATAVEMRDTLLAIAHRNPWPICAVHGSDRGNADHNKDLVEPVKIGRKNKKKNPLT